MVTASVVGALALFETVLPWAFAALRKWRRERAKEAGEPDALCPVPCAGNEVTVPCPLSSVREKAGEGQRTEDGGQRQWPLDFGRTEELTEANRLWEEARGMAHRFTPDWEKDQECLSKIYAAARLGHLEAMVKLGDYAYRRGAVVEAFYWTLLAELKGANGLDEALCEMRTRWLAEGCPEEYENAYEEFNEEQGVFARAVLRLQCDVDPQYACACLEELAERGVEEARLFLET